MIQYVREVREFFFMYTPKTTERERGEYDRCLFITF